MMKKAILFRIFVAFPLFGIAMPDFTFKCINPEYEIPGFHYFIFILLIALVMISFLVEIVSSSDNYHLPKRNHAFEKV